MWGNQDDDNNNGIFRHRPLRWSSNGYEIRDRVRQMVTIIRAVDRHIAEQIVLNTQFKKAVMEMRAKYKQDEPSPFPHSPAAIIEGAVHDCGAAKENKQRKQR